jgi:carboxyl-terminal processing protease
MLATATVFGILFLLPPGAAQAVQPSVPFHADEAERVFSYGYDVIQDRALEKVDAQALAIEGLRGLSTIDPALTIDSADGRVRLGTPDGIVAAYDAPPADDSAAWAALTVRLTNAGRAVSPAMARADNEAVYEAVFDSLLATLDHFSRYAGYDEARRHREQRNGFGGVGIRYSIEPDWLQVDEVLSDTPASEAGLRDGDRILAIDGQPVATIGPDRNDVRGRLRGAIDSPLRLTVDRAGIQRDIILHRGLVVPQTAFLDSTAEGIAHIRVSSFNQRTTRGVAEAVDDAKRRLGRDLRGVLLDLRGNPGGLLDQAVGVSDLFLTRGRIVFTKGRHPESQQSYVAHGGDILDGLPMTVLLDGRSASAAEIVSAALQDSGRAVLVGSSSYGKGTVQTVIRLPNQGEMTLTWSRFHTPSGYALHGLGVMPTVCVARRDEPGQDALNLALGTATDISAQLAQWRTVPLSDTISRKSLREHCPARSHSEWTNDLSAARALLLDHGLYARALALTRPQSAQR